MQVACSQDIGQRKRWTKRVLWSSRMTTAGCAIRCVWLVNCPWAAAVGSCNFKHTMMAAGGRCTMTSSRCTWKVRSMGSSSSSSDRTSARGTLQVGGRREMTQGCEFLSGGHRQHALLLACTRGEPTNEQCRARAQTTVRSEQCYSSTGSDVYTVALMPAVMWAAPRVAPFARMAYGLAIRRGLAEYVRMSWSQPAAPLPPPIPPPSPRSPCQWCGPRCLPRWPMLLSRLASSAECLCSWLCSILPLF